MSARPVKVFTLGDAFERLLAVSSKSREAGQMAIDRC
jgi:hypothetical protein